MDQLPLVLLLQIAEYSVETWKSFVSAHPRVGRWSLQPEYQKYIQRKYTKCIEYQRNDGIIRKYKLCNKRHNVDGPAVEYADGTREWWLNGRRHRDNDLPAVECASGTKFWYKNGKVHRDGDLPAGEYASGAKEWYKNGKFHRDDDLPAVEYVDGSKFWYKNGLYHRDNDFPAIEYSNGHKKWYRDGRRYFPAGR